MSEHCGFIVKIEHLRKRGIKNVRALWIYCKN